MTFVKKISYMEYYFAFPMVSIVINGQVHSKETYDLRRYDVDSWVCYFAHNNLITLTEACSAGKISNLFW